MTWRRLSGVDASFLYAETPSAPLHVIGTLVLEAGARAEADYRSLRARLASRLEALPLLRRRVVEVPLGLGHPVWSDDPGFDLDAHLVRARLPAPGGDAELAAWVARLAETPLRRDRPLWEIHVVEGLARRRVALVAKIHHAAVDGVGGARMLATLLDAAPDAPDGDEVPAPAPPDRAALPSAVELLADAARALGEQPLRGARELWQRRGTAPHWLAALARAPGLARAPRTRLSRRVSSRRAVAMGSVPLADVKLVGNAFAATVNHVVLAACAGALRRYLGEHGEIPRRPLVAAVPMALGCRSSDGAGNALSVMRVALPVHLADALDRLHAARESSRAALRAHDGLGGDLGAWVELVAPALLAGAVRAYTRLGLAEWHAPLHDLVISNVPGPAEPLYCAGRRVARCHPFGPVYDGAALNLTVMSYAGGVGLGAIACPEAVPHLALIPRAFEASVAQLRRLAAREEGAAAERVARS